MNKFAATAVIALLSAVPSYAGGYVAPVEVEPVVVPAPAPEWDWTGFQVGVTVGTATTETSLFSGFFEDENDSSRYGVLGRYLYDLGDFVVGAQLMYEHILVEDSIVEDATRFSGSILAGYDLGRVLPYAQVGVTRFDTGNLETVENGVAYGVGAMMAATDRIILSVDYTHTEYEDYLEEIFPGDGELTADAFRLGATFRF